VAARRREDEERLRDLKLRGLAELAAGAAHEINNPLAVISGQAQHLLKTEESLERAKSLERIIAQCKRIYAVLTDLMFYARPPQLQPRVINPGKLLAEVKSTLARQAGERNVTLTVEPGEFRGSLHADPELLARALGCLAANGIEAAPAEGWVRLSFAANSAEQIDFHVEDNGAGLSTLEREHLFDPFFSGRAAGRGTGLGLAKAWRIATLHGGQLRFACEPGQPTCFTLSLPVTASASGKSHARTRRSTNGRGHRVNGKPQPRR
jgi:signal transduction histidine kinase